MKNILNAINTKIDKNSKLIATTDFEELKLQLVYENDGLLFSRKVIEDSLKSIYPKFVENIKCPRCGLMFPQTTDINCINIKPVKKV